MKPARLHTSTPSVFQLIRAIAKARQRFRKIRNNVRQRLTRNTQLPSSLCPQVPVNIENVIPPSLSPPAPSDLKTIMPRNRWLELSVDIWTLILEDDGLELLDVLRLSHTCKDLRALITHDWPSADVRQLLPVGRLEFSTTLASSSLDRWACATCSKLKPVSFDDTPKDLDYDGCKRVWWEPHETRFEPSYSLQYSHVQLALKYTRKALPGSVYEEYLARLMAPHCNQYAPWRDTCGEIVYEAEPKIVDGRFLLREEWIFFSRDVATRPATTGRDVSFQHVCTEIQHDRLHVCAHLEGRSGPDGIPESERTRENEASWSTDLHRNMRRALKGRSWRRYGFSCPYCPTDCEVCLWGLRTRSGCQPFVLRVWKDLGCESSMAAQWYVRTNNHGSALEASYDEPGRVRRAFGPGTPQKLLPRAEPIEAEPVDD